MFDKSSRYALAHTKGMDGASVPAVFELGGYSAATNAMLARCISMPDVVCLTGPLDFADVIAQFNTRDSAFAALRNNVARGDEPKLPLIHPAPTEVSAELMAENPILRFFAYAHLPTTLQLMSKPFFDLALFMVANLSPSAERTAALRKLLEAKDCAVRAAIPATTL